MPDTIRSNLKIKRREIFINSFFRFSLFYLIILGLFFKVRVLFLLALALLLQLNAVVNVTDPVKEVPSGFGSGFGGGFGGGHGCGVGG